jgi:hypothetical protein
LDAIHAGHGEVGNDDVEGMFLEDMNAFFAAGRGEDFVLALEHRPNSGVQIPNQGIVIHKENAILHERTGNIGRGEERLKRGRKKLLPVARQEFAKIWKID